MKLYVLCVVMVEHAVPMEEIYHVVVLQVLPEIHALKVRNTNIKIGLSYNVCIRRMPSKYIWCELHPAVQVC